MKNNIKHIFILSLIFISVLFIGYEFYKFTQNFDNEKEEDTTIQDNTAKTVKSDSGDVRVEKTSPDTEGEKIKVKSEGKIELDEGSWDFICEKPSNNGCSAAILQITSPDDKDLDKKHPVDEYIVVDGNKKYNYKVNGTDGSTKGLYFRKRKDN